MKWVVINLLIICANILFFRKDRFDPIFSFHEEGSAGVKVDRSGHGLLKVWKQQLLQFKNVSPDVAQALIAAYPSPQLLRQVSLITWCNSAEGLDKQNVWV